MDGPQRQDVFRPASTKFWLPLLVGPFLLLIGILFLLLPVFAATSHRESAAMVVVGVCGVVLSLLGLWLFSVAFRLKGAVVRIGDDGLELKAQLWALWKPKKFRAARIRWDEIQNVKLCEIDNFILPDRIDHNYILVTTQGQFVVQTTVWGDQARRIAELVAERIRQPIHVPDAASAAEQAADCRLSPAELWGVKLMRGFGWLCTILTGLFMLLIFIGLWGAKPADRPELVLPLLIGGFTLYGAASLRRFKIRMG
jgi:hypothetical protein